MGGAPSAEQKLPEAQERLGGGSGELGELLPVETVLEHLLKNVPCNAELCWTSVGKAAACGKPMWDQLGKSMSMGGTAC